MIQNFPLDAILFPLTPLGVIPHQTLFHYFETYHVKVLDLIPINFIHSLDLSPRFIV